MTPESTRDRCQDATLPSTHDGPVLLALSHLIPHPDNPRLIERTEVIEQIRAQINGSFDPAHAILVRPLDDGTYQIVAEHNRVAAARAAGLTEIPGWVRALDDEAAYMLLLTSNAQSELTALERGMHALKATTKGKHKRSVKAYAKEVGRADRTVAHEVEAATVFDEVCPRGQIPNFIDRARHLAEIYAAPHWLWAALVRKMQRDELTVERTVALVRSVKAFNEEPPDCLNIGEIAQAVADGTMETGEIMQMIAALARYCEMADEECGGPGGSLAAQVSHFIPDDRLAKIARLIDLEDLLRPMIRKIEDAGAARRRAEQETRDRARALRRAVSLAQWPKLNEAVKTELLNVTETTGSFNRQEGAEVEWAQWSWNPVAGCEHDCPYCYARDIALHKARDVYPFGFEPMLRPNALAIPQHMQVPLEAAADMRFRNVFTVSMGDLFGRWVPAEWIEAVLRSCRAAPDWNFLMLTKFPKRMAEFDIPPNCWMGTTVDLQARVANAEAAFARVEAGVRWLSVEPMIEPLRFSRLDLFQWIVIGGAKRTEQPDGRTPDWHPPFPWIADLVTQARAARVRVYFKTNLLGHRILELPFDAPIRADPTEAPALFHYLGQGRARLEI